MKTRVLESPARRVAVAVAVLTVLILVAGGLYILFSSPPARPVNGLKLIAAAQAYTRGLIKNHAPVPSSVPLQVLVDQGLLEPADIGSLQGLDVKIFLTTRDPSGHRVIMSVRLSDGTDLTLFADGSSRKLTPPK
jgi:hypothetical protein